MTTATIEEIINNNKNYLVEKGLRVKRITEKKEIRLKRERMVGMIIQKDFFDIKKMCDKGND